MLPVEPPGCEKFKVQLEGTVGVHNKPGVLSLSPATLVSLAHRARQTTLAE